MELEINEERYKIRSEEVMWRLLDNEAVVLNIRTGFYYSLNHIGTEIWCSLAKELPLNNIITSISEKYEIPFADVKRDTIEILAELRSAKLIS